MDSRKKPGNGSKQALLLILGGLFVSVAAVSAFLPPSVQTTMLGLLILLVLAVLLFGSNRVPEINVDLLEGPIELARDEQVFAVYRRLVEDLRKISRHSDPILRDLALHRTGIIADELASIGKARIEFVGTETWRIAYDRLLRSAGLHLYRSVSVIRAGGYWQDEPGRQSIQTNFDLLDAGTLNIERIAIIADDLWPAEQRFPTEPIRAWIEQQHLHGLWISLVRQSQVRSDPELSVDMGIYGSRAVGIQETDDAGQTLRYSLQFGVDHVEAAEQKWERLRVYATSYRSLLDQDDGSA